MVHQSPARPSAAVVDEAQVLELVGGAAHAELFTFGGVTAANGLTGTLIITDAGGSPDRSGVWNAEEVRVLGPVPPPVRERLAGSPHTWSSDAASLPIHLAVRVTEGLLYLGTGRVVRSELTRRPGDAESVLTRCVLRPDLRLSRPLLDRVRATPPAEGLPDLEWLQHVNGDRLLALEQFVTGWYPAIPDAEKTPLTPELSAALPDGLKHLYRLAEQRPDVLGVQNHIVRDPERGTDFCGEMRVFGVENQGCFSWSLRWEFDEPEPDPTVWFRETDEPPVAEQEPLSGFLIQFSLYEASMGADYGAHTNAITAEQVERLTTGLRLVPLRPFLAWSPTRFYVAPGLVMHVSKDMEDGLFWAWAGATHRSAMAPLDEDAVDWSRFDA